MQEQGARRDHPVPHARVVNPYLLALLVNPYLLLRTPLPDMIAGGTRYCIQHGGGGKSAACESEGCKNKARGGTTLCLTHGVWNRCSFLGCTKTALQVTTYPPIYQMARSRVGTALDCQTQWFGYRAPLEAGYLFSGSP